MHGERESDAVWRIRGWSVEAQASIGLEIPDYSLSPRFFQRTPKPDRPL
jgi:hypothetical protein